MPRDAGMQYQRLGQSPVEVSRIVFGAMARGASGEDVRRPLVQAALASGMTTIDTAPLYEFGDSERWVGRAIQDQRDRAVLCTKVGLRWDTEHGDILFSGPDSDGQHRTVRMDSRPAAVQTEVDRSLERMGTDVLDLVQVHFPDRHTPIAETMRALADCVRRGTVRAVGVSNYDLAQTQTAHLALGDVPLASVQVAYSLVDRRIEADLLPWARDHRVGVLAYSPLAEGLLAGKYLDAAPPEPHHALTEPRFVGAVRTALRTTLQPIADRHRASMAQIALAWLLAQPGVTAVVAGASRPDQVQTNADAATLRLSTDDESQLRRAFAAISVEASGRGLRRWARAAKSRAKALWRRLR